MSKTQPSPQNVVPLHRGASVGHQLPLLPLRIASTIPSPLESADLKELVQTIDGHFYALKTTGDHAFLPASEFLCYKLAAACNLPVPFSALIELSEGQGIGFGSRFEGGIEDPRQLSSREQISMYQQSKGPISAIIALDHFVGNDDRHKGNFIWRRNFRGEWVPLAIDYSRALFVRGFPGDAFPLSESCNTRSTVKMLKHSDLWDGPFAVFALGSLTAVTVDNLRHWLEEMPLAWLDLQRRHELVTWWGSDAFSQRLQAVYQML